MNTAKFTLVVEVHTDKLVIVRDPLSGFVSCCSPKQLWEAVHGRPQATKPEPRFETVEEFLARGGTIKQVGFPPPPPRPAVPVEPPKPKKDPKKISLEDLGF